MKGAKISLEVLGLFENHIKICVTPGLVELGEESKNQCRFWKASCKNL